MDKLQSDKQGFTHLYDDGLWCKRIKRANKTAFWNERINGKATKIGASGGQDIIETRFIKL